MNQGIHTMDMISVDHGRRDVRCRPMVRTAAHDIEVEDQANVLVEYRNGAVGVIQGSTAYYPGFAERLEVHGEHGSVVIEGDRTKVWRVDPERAKLGQVRRRRDGPADAEPAPRGRGRVDRGRPHRRLGRAAPASDRGLRRRRSVRTATPSSPARWRWSRLRTILAVYESARQGGARVECPDAMRLGLCCNPSEGPAALALGYDYVEYPADAHGAERDDEPVLPGDVRSTGPRPTASSGARRSSRRARARGVQVMVLGSGGVRRRAGRAEAEFYDLAAALDRHAQTLGLRVAPESLNPDRDRRRRPPSPTWPARSPKRGAPYTADSYHALVETGTRRRRPGLLARTTPLRPDPCPLRPLRPQRPDGRRGLSQAFFARLRELGYDGRASLECRRDGIPDPAPLRRLLGSASFQEALRRLGPAGPG